MYPSEIDKIKNECMANAIDMNGGSVVGCWNFMTDEEKNVYNEMNFRHMIHSCLTYGQGNEIYDFYTGVIGNYGFMYYEKMNDKDRFIEIVVEEIQFFKDHAKVNWGVHTDDEGCTYNSIDWDNEKN